MTPLQISAVEAHFATLAAANFPDLPVTFSAMAVPDVSFHARIAVQAASAAPQGLGLHSATRTTGTLRIDVTGPKDRGVGPTQDVAFDMGGWFRDLDLSTADGPIRFNRPVLSGETVGESYVSTTRIGWKAESNG